MPWGGGALAKPYLARLPDGSAAFSCCDYNNSLPGQDVQNFFSTLNKNKLKNNNIENIMYAYLASMKNRNAVMFARKNEEPLNLLDCLLNVQGEPLEQKQITKIQEEFEPLFSKKLLNTVIKKFENTGEYNMYAVEIGCAMAITYLIFCKGNKNVAFINRASQSKRTTRDDITPLISVFRRLRY